MLLRNNTRIIEKVIVDLYFDDDTEKHVEIAPKDIVSINYNSNGFNVHIEGKVIGITATKDINIHPSCTAMQIPNPPKEGYLTIDGSGIYNGNKANIYFSHILDCEMIEKYDESLLVKTVTDGKVNGIRISDGKLQVSTDNRITWIDVSTLIATEEDVTPPTGTGNAEEETATE